MPWLLAVEPDGSVVCNALKVIHCNAEKVIHPRLVVSPAFDNPVWPT